MAWNTTNCNCCACTGVVLLWGSTQPFDKRVVNCSLQMMMSHPIPSELKSHKNNWLTSLGLLASVFLLMKGIASMSPMSQSRECVTTTVNFRAIPCVAHSFAIWTMLAMTFMGAGGSFHVPHKAICCDNVLNCHGYHL